MRLFVLVSLLAAAGPAAAQSPTPPQQPEHTAPPRASGLNLKLDEADLRALSGNASTPRDQVEQPRADLPSLGGNARSIEQAPRKIERTSPFPENTSPGH